MTNPKNNLVHEYNVDGAPVCLFDLSKSSDKITAEEYKLLMSRFIESEEDKQIFQVITSTGINFLRHQKFDRINKLLNSYQEFYTKEVVGIENQFTIVHSWMTKNKDSSRHHNHNHQNAMLSVLYYFNENLDDYLMANIFFRQKALINVFPNHHFRFNHTKVKTKYNINELDIPTRNHTLLVFPGYLEHGTRPSENTCVRYCLGTNYFITGKLGSISEYTFLNIEIKHE